jgi:hypothetical protein
MMLIIDVNNAAKASLRSMVGFTDGGCSCRTAGAPGELKTDNVRGGGMGGVIQPKTQPHGGVWRYRVETGGTKVQSLSARRVIVCRQDDKDCL